MNKNIGRVLSLLGAGLLAWFVTARAWRIHQENRAKRKITKHNRDAKRVPKPGDILLFYRPKRFRDVIIQIGTGSRVYHAALFVKQSENGPLVLEARPQGVHINDLRGREGKYVVLPAPQHKGEQALAWARSQIGSPYDFKDGLVIGLEHVFRRWRINYTRPGSYTCGELIAAAYEKAGVQLVPNKNPSEVAPGDIARALTKHHGMLQ